MRQRTANWPGAALAAGLVLSPGQGAHAQTFDEAVRANLSLATTLCLQTMIQRVPPAAAFGGAGFVYRGVDRGVNSFGVALGLDHYFDAPADTARAEVDEPNGTAGLCQVYSTHLAEAELAAIVGGALAALYPATQMRSPTEWSIPTPSGLPLIVTTETIGTNNRYEAPGTVRATMVYPG
jgi:hypothetical protein